MSAHFRRRVFPTALPVLGVLGLFLSEAACGGSDNPDAGVHDAGVHDSATEDRATRDTGRDGRSDAADGGSMEAAPDSRDETYPAFTPPVPQLTIASLTGTVMAKPNVRPVYFAGETLAAEIDGLVAQYLASSAWTAQTKEYGIGAATLLPAVMSTDTPAASLMDSDVQAWLSGQLDGTHPEFGTVDAATLANEIFVLYYPASTTITVTGEMSCSGFGYSYSDFAFGLNHVTYIIVPRCTGAAGTMFNSCAAVLATAGNPLSGFQTGYFGFDASHAVWDLVSGDPDLSAPCGEGQTGTQADSETSILLDGGTRAPRGWSNDAMAAYHDPCVPAADPTPYFASVPVMNDAVIGVFNGRTGVTKGIKVASGHSKVVDVELWSDGPTSGPWKVGAEVFPGGTVPAAALTFGFDKTMGKNGDVLHLTVTPHQPGPIPFVVVSTLSIKQTRWFGLVGQ